MLGTLSAIAFLVMVLSWAIVQPARERMAKSKQ